MLQGMDNEVRRQILHERELDGGHKERTLVSKNEELRLKGCCPQTGYLKRQRSKRLLTLE